MLVAWAKLNEVVVLISLSTAALCSVFPEDKFHETFVGEAENCDDVFARVKVVDGLNVVNESAIVSAIAGSYAQASYDASEAIAASQAVAEKILQVTAEAVATIDASIVSPTPGCWGLAYGEAEAVAIAGAVVNAMAEGVAQALGETSEASIELFAQSTEYNVTQAIESVALLLVSGDGSDLMIERKSVVATAKATAVNCAMAKSFAKAFDEEQAIAIVLAGCPEKEPIPEPEEPVTRIVDFDPCDCGSQYRSFCGPWGGSKDNICYVLDPVNCTCAQNSTIYDGQKWRFCGDTLDVMKKWLTVTDEANDIYPTREGYGYCPRMKPIQDRSGLQQQQPSSEVEPPAPPPVILQRCPSARCQGSARNCCDIDPLENQRCSVFNNQITYNYERQCIGNRHVWSLEVGTFSCYC